MKQFLKTYYRIEQGVCSLAFIIMIVACIIQVTNRNITKFSIGWTEELARYSMIWMVFIGAAISLRQGKQMSIEFFYGLLKPSGKKANRILVHLLNALFLGVVGWTSISHFQMQLGAKQVSTALKLPSALVFSIVPISFLIMLVGEIILLLLEFNKSGSDTTTQENEL